MADRQLRLYDTMTGVEKPVELLEPGHLRFYSCGPTVYSYAHIGNFRTFLTADLIVRTAEALGWRVSYVSNITDVGHLTQDDVADAGGEDKMAKALGSKEGERFHNVWELAEYYEAAFLDDWRRLNLKDPMVRPKATQHMREQILAAEQLVDNKNAYETPTGVYFDIDSFPEYGKLSGNTKDKLLSAVRDVVLDENKHQQADFALWKKDDKHLMQWFSPYGWGFPGWHLECSVMAMQYLGETIDLHGGGEDLRFPHHECEIAQAEALTGKPFCNHWVHTKFLQVNGQKMSKSLGNYYTVRSLLDKGIDALAIRLALISTVYIKPANFTDQLLLDAAGNIERIRHADSLAAEALENGADGPDSVGSPLDDLYEQALDAMCGDLNTSVAIAKLFEGVKLVGREPLTKLSGQSAKRFFDNMNALLGIIRLDNAYADIDLPGKKEAGIDEAWVEEQIAARTAAKQSKDFAQADAIRKELDAKGIELRDSPQGTTWVRKTQL